MKHFQLRTSLGNAVETVLADFERYFSLQDRNDRTVKEAVGEIFFFQIFKNVLFKFWIFLFKFHPFQ